MTSAARSFPIAAMVRNADNHAHRARLVLRTPDAIIVCHGAEIQEACIAAHFETGAHYVAVRWALLNATPDRNGELPADYRRNLAMWRSGMVAIAGGTDG